MAERARTPAEREKRDASDFLRYEDSAGRFADFHGATRHTFIRNLTAGGAKPKEAQALARHSTITLTLDRYSHLATGDEAGALEVLPDLALPEAEPEEAEATGTDGRNATSRSSGLSGILAPKDGKQRTSADARATRWHP